MPHFLQTRIVSRSSLFFKRTRCLHVGVLLVREGGMQKNMLFSSKTSHQVYMEGLWLELVVGVLHLKSLGG
jgi:hypothetical protein